MTNETNCTIEEKVASLFQPDILLAAQYVETVRTRASLEPEKRLMLAVLEDAVLCFQKHMSAEAEEWIMDENGDWLFSFENICHVLGLSPAYLRQGLLRWKRKKVPYLPLVRQTGSPSLGHRMPKSDNGKRGSAVVKEAYQEKRVVQLR